MKAFLAIIALCAVSVSAAPERTTVAVVLPADATTHAVVSDNSSSAKQRAGQQRACSAGIYIWNDILRLLGFRGTSAINMCQPPAPTQPQNPQPQNPQPQNPQPQNPQPQNPQVPNPPPNPNPPAPNPPQNPQVPNPPQPNQPSQGQTAPASGGIISSVVGAIGNAVGSFFSFFG